MIHDLIAYWTTGGPLMIALAAAGFGIWYYFLKMRGALLRVLRTPEVFEAQLQSSLRSHSIEENIASYGNKPGALSVSVAYVLASVERDEDPDVAFEQIQRAHFTAWEQDAVLLSALTTAAPLLGLLGTVIGMIATFRAVSGDVGDTAANISKGISQALITTQFGLVVAIPGLFGMARIRRLLDQAGVRMGTCKTTMLMQLENEVTRRAEK